MAAEIAELERLLRRDAEPIRQREAQLRSSLTGGRMPLVLYGAGTIGRSLLTILRDSGIEPAAFADETPVKHGTMAEGVPVLPPAEAVAKAGGACTIAVTILNPRLPFLAARERLAAVTDAPVLSAFEVARSVARAPLPVPFVEPVDDLLARAGAIRETARLLERDPESLEQLLAHLRFRLELDYAALPRPGSPQYFPPAVLDRLDRGSVRFVDGGAYDGDTLRALLALRPDAVAGVFAFEPDRSNFDRLGRYVASLPPDVRAKVKLSDRALGDEPGRARFTDTGDEAAAVARTGACEIEVVALDQAIAPDGPLPFIKLDVEGSEAAALRGAQRLLERACPLLAVSVYHRPEDLWEIPRHLASLDLGYRLILRTHGWDGMDVVLYALPR